MNAALELNEKGFEGDIYLEAEFHRLVDKYRTKVIIETGTYLGNTTLKLADMADHVFTIERNINHYNLAAAKFADKPMIRNCMGDSAAMLGFVLGSDEFKKINPVTPLLFLDAHWGDNNPLLQELETIAQHNVKPVIVIHDFKVPGHPELGYDSYDGQDYEWSWIKDAVEKIYDFDDYSYHYNTQAEGAKRGVIFIEPK